MAKSNRNIYILALKILWLPALICTYYFFINYLIAGYGYSPAQPVYFSHKVHSGDYQIKCLFCHVGAEKTAFSDIPSSYSCMVCHTALKTETDRMKPLIISYDSKVPIKWNRIYRLPEYSHFNHYTHINASIDCASCHSEVEKMEVIYKTTYMSMQWCLNCHREPQKYIIPTREISGVFIYPDNKSILAGESIKLAESKPFIYPDYGMYYTGERKNNNSFLLTKLPGKGPETCSACHY